MRTIARWGFKDWLVKTGDDFHHVAVKVEIDLEIVHTTGHFCFTQRRHARNALIIRGNRYQSLRTLRRCVENVQ
jgi:hypothetical protein